MPDSSSGSETETDENVKNVKLMKLKIKLAKLKAEQKEKDREEKEKEREEREKEREEREKERIEAQKDHERRLEWAATQRSLPQRTESTRESHRENERIRIPRIEDHSDAQAILTTFERHCRACSVQESTYVTKLFPFLGPKVIRAVTRLPEEHATEYTVVKSAILTAFQLTPDQHKKKFRSMTKKFNENYIEASQRLKDNFELWIASVDDIDLNKLKDLMLREQFENMLPSELKVWMADRQPKTLAEAATLADRFTESRRDEKKSPWDKTTNQQERPQKTYEPHFTENEVICYVCNRRGHFARDCKQKLYTGYQKESYTGYQKEQPYTGYQKEQSYTGYQKEQPYTGYQKEIPHTLKQKEQPDTANNKEPPYTKTSFYVQRNQQEQDNPYNGEIKINKKKCTMLRDTGSGISLVCSQMIRPEQLTKEFIAVKTITGEIKKLRSARVLMECAGIEKVVEVAVAEQLPFDCLLGNDLGPKLRPVGETKDEAGKTHEGIENGEHYSRGVVINGRYIRRHTILQERGAKKQKDSMVNENQPHQLSLGNDNGQEMIPVVKQCFVITRAQTNRDKMKDEQWEGNGPETGQGGETDLKKYNCHGQQGDKEMKREKQRGPKTFMAIGSKVTSIEEPRKLQENDREISALKKENETNRSQGKRRRNVHGGWIIISKMAREEEGGTVGTDCSAINTKGRGEGYGPRYDLGGTPRN